METTVYLAAAAVLVIVGLVATVVPILRGSSWAPSWGAFLGGLWACGGLAQAGKLGMAGPALRGDREGGDDRDLLRLLRAEFAGLGQDITESC